MIIDQIELKHLQKYTAFVLHYYSDLRKQKI
jgi:hypothetical protein